MELKLKKGVAGKWEALEGDGTGGAQAYNSLPAADGAKSATSVYSGARAPRCGAACMIIPALAAATCSLRARTPLSVFDFFACGVISARSRRDLVSGSSRDWDAIDTDIKRKEEEEKPEGEEALNKLFRQVTGGAALLSWGARGSRRYLA